MVGIDPLGGAGGRGALGDTNTLTQPQRSRAVSARIIETLRSYLNLFAVELATTSLGRLDTNVYASVNAKEHYLSRRSEEQKNHSKEACYRFNRF